MSYILLCSKLKDLLANIGENERNLDRQREFLCEMKNFSTLSSFNALDRLQLQYLTHTDLHSLFAQQKMNFSYEDTCLLLKNIDKNNDLKIMHEEWEDLLLCRRNYQLRQNVLSRVNIEPLQKNDRVFAQIVMVLSQIVRNAKDYDMYRQRLASTYDYSDINCFNFIDIDKKGFITCKDLDYFLKERGKYLSEEEIQQLIYFADVDQDDCLNFEEFSRLILVGAPAPVQTSPKKSRIIQSPSQIRQDSNFQIQQTRQLASPEQFCVQPIAQLNYPLIKSPAKFNRLYQTQREFSSSKKQANQFSIHQCNEKLIELLKRMIEFERLLMETKSQLAIQPDFNLMDLFRLLDVNQNENISKIEFEKGVNSIEIFPTTNQIYLFFAEFDTNKDGFLDFGDFSKIFYVNNLCQNESLKKRNIMYVEPLEGQTILDIFSQNTRLMIKNLFLQIFDTQNSLDYFKEYLYQQPDFNLYEAFKKLSNYFDEITYEGLKESLENYGVFTTEDEMVKLFQKMDKDQNGIVKIGEFAEEIRNKSPNRINK